MLGLPWPAHVDGLTGGLPIGRFESGARAARSRVLPFERRLQ